MGGLLWTCSGFRQSILYRCAGGTLASGAPSGKLKVRYPVERWLAIRGGGGIFGEVAVSP